MATITITGGGSIPERSKSFTSDGTPEGHKQIFTEVDDFIRNWETATQAQDAKAEIAGEAEPTETSE